MKTLTILAAAVALAVAQAMPAADYNFKPNDEEMSFGKVMTHRAQNNIRAFATVSGLKPLETPDRIAAACADPKGGITPEKADAMFGTATGRERLWSCFTYTAHHRGQAARQPPCWRVTCRVTRLQKLFSPIHQSLRAFPPAVPAARMLLLR